MMGMSMQDLADRVGVSYGIHVAGGARSQQHGREGTGAGGVGVAGPGEGCARTVRQPPGMRGNRGEQLHPGSGPGSWA